MNSPSAFDFSMFDREADWLASQPGMSPWKDGCAMLAARLEAMLQEYAPHLCARVVREDCPHDGCCLRRLWQCWACHWKQGAEIQPNGGIDGREVADRIRSGIGYQGKKQLGGNPLRDVILAQAVECGERDAILCLEEEYKQGAIGLAIKVNRRVADEPDDWWSEFRDALGGYRKPPGKLATFRGKCGLKNWLGTVARRFAMEYPAQVTSYDTTPEDVPRTEPSDECTPEMKAVLRERAAEVRKALDQLSKADHLLFHLLFVEELPQIEIAAILGINEGTLTRRKQRLLRRFRKLLPNLGEEQENE